MDQTKSPSHHWSHLDIDSLNSYDRALGVAQQIIVNLTIIPELEAMERSHPTPYTQDEVRTIKIEQRRLLAELERKMPPRDAFLAPKKPTNQEVEERIAHRGITIVSA